MAQKRMFDKAITNSDTFLELTDACQNLYFHLSMNADDDGFVDNWKSILRMTNHKPSDMQELAKASFIIPFESGVIVIRHWRMNNYLRTDRYKETTHKLEKSLLKLGENEEYLLDNDVFGIPMVNPNKNSIDKNSIEYKKENNISKDILKEKRFTPPTLEEIRTYCEERKNNVDAKKFFDYYEANDWKDNTGKKVKSWKQKMIANWEKDNNPKKNRRDEVEEMKERFRKMEENNEL